MLSLKYTSFFIQCLHHHHHHPGHPPQVSQKAVQFCLLVFYGRGNCLSHPLQLTVTCRPGKPHVGMTKATQLDKPHMTFRCLISESTFSKCNQCRSLNCGSFSPTSHHKIVLFGRHFEIFLENCSSKFVATHKRL